MVQNRVFGNNNETSWKGKPEGPGMRGVHEGTGTDWVLTRWHGKRYRVELPSQGRYFYFQDQDRKVLQSILNMLDLEDIYHLDEAIDK
jgi:hypothetical protein